MKPETGKKYFFPCLTAVLLFNYCPHGLHWTLLFYLFSHTSILFYIFQDFSGLDHSPYSTKKKNPPPQPLCTNDSLPPPPPSSSSSDMVSAARVLGLPDLGGGVFAITQQQGVRGTKYDMGLDQLSKYKIII